MGPLPDTWWMRRIQNGMTWMVSLYESFHFDIKNRRIFLFCKPPVPSGSSGSSGPVKWGNYWKVQLPTGYIIQTFIRRHYHVGWFIWKVCERVERLWKRIRNI